LRVGPGHPTLATLSHRGGTTGTGTHPVVVVQDGPVPRLGRLSQPESRDAVFAR
jgi:hypothetical protein